MMKDNTIKPVDKASESLDRETRESTRRALRHPATRVEWLETHWMKTKDPMSAWEAISICQRHKFALPDWVLDYLGGCADQVLSGQALGASLGFKRGPRRGFDDQQAVDRAAFMKLFDRALDTETTLEDALDRARHALSPDDTRCDDLTLQRWLADEFYLDHVPRTLDTWRAALEWRTVIVREVFGRTV